MLGMMGRVSGSLRKQTSQSVAVNQGHLRREIHKTRANYNENTN